MSIQVLVVDDLPFMRTLLREVLETGGHMVVGEAQDGRDGLIQYVVRKPDVVLLDIAMPVMDGIAALERIIRFDPRARVIMCSSMGEQDMILRAIQLGARDFIVKPFHSERVTSAVEKAMKYEVS
ncbi:MAG: response regulator [Spirochaetaceae bacterium]|nr:MAG: response regulator [Spirochaetaceae bacterium]